MLRARHLFPFPGAALFLALLAASPAQLGAQSGTPAPAAAPEAPQPAEDSVPGAPKALPSAFRGISLGMGLEELKAALVADPLFNFRGDRDVSLLPVKDQVLVETTGLSFVRRAFFQLKGGKVFTMALDLNPDKVDHDSVFTSFVADYGEPSSLDPREAVWLSDAVRVSIERPLTVKYIDRAAFDELSRNSKVEESREYVLRKEFLDAF